MKIKKTNYYHLPIKLDENISDIFITNDNIENVDNEKKLKD